MMRRREPCDLLVIDEAAQAVEAECLIAFQLRPKSVIFVGDPNQLSAMAQSDVARRAGYERSTMQRLFEKSSVPCNLLSTQYRMNPEISSFPNSQFYENRIFNSSVVCEKSRRFRFSKEKLPIIFKDLRIYHVEDEGEGKCVLSPYNVLNVSQGRERRVGGSYCNANEAEIAATLCHALLGDKHGKRKRSLSSPRISVITFYNAQVRAIKDKLPYGYDDSDVRVSTVDSFQGSESEVVILSCVRSNSRHAVGFVSEFRRLNVALTRAKLGLIVLCHAPTLENCPSKDLKMLVRNARERGLLHCIATSSNNNV
jgi:senataxin